MVLCRKDTAMDPNTDRAVKGHLEAILSAPPATPPALCITALLSKPLGLLPTHWKGNPPVFRLRVESHTSPVPHPPPALTPQQGGLLPLPAQMNLFMGLPSPDPTALTGSPSFLPGFVTSWITHFMPFHSLTSSPKRSMKPEFCWHISTASSKLTGQVLRKNHSNWCHLISALRWFKSWLDTAFFYPLIFDKTRNRQCISFLGYLQMALC